MGKDSKSPPEYISPIGIDELQAVASTEGDGVIDTRSAKLRGAEAEHILRRRRNYKLGSDDTQAHNLVGMALSGGGIRSATFSLGVLQAFAASGILKRIDYLSTVSGGGYIGSTLSWLLSDKAKVGCTDKELPPFDAERAHIPFGADDPDPEIPRQNLPFQDRILRYLREHGEYLTPGAGISGLSLLGVVMRSTFLNLLVWIPLFVGFFLFGLWFFSWLGYTCISILAPIFTMLRPEVSCPTKNITLLHPAESACSTLKSQGIYDTALNNLPALFGFDLFLLLGLGILLFFSLASVGYSIITWFRRHSDQSAQFWYSARREVERWYGTFLSIALLLLIVGSLPIVHTWLSGWLAAAGPLALFSGMFMLIRYFLTSASGKAGPSPGLLATTGSALFLYGVALVSLDLAMLAFFPEENRLSGLIVTGIFVAIAVVTGRYVNLNYICIHRYYRDRLMETFMPDIDSALTCETGEARAADQAWLQDLVGSGLPRAPYHIVNTNLVLVDSSEKTYEERGGDNFILSPYYCGSNATGWCATGQFMEGRMTLASAVAVSGAAANPNTGVGGEGLTRDRVLSLVMSLLNLRLGFWATHPNPERRKSLIPNHFAPGFRAFFTATGFSSFGFTESRSFLQLSDGGHFENTGVYELIRRRVKLIIVCDGGADPDFSFSDFQTTVRRIEDDFGARVKVFDNASPDEIVPIEMPGCEYPWERKFAKQGYMLGRFIHSC